MTRYKRNICGAILLTAASACADAEPAENGFGRAVGVLAPTLRIDGHEHSLTYMGEMAVGPDGTIAFLQPQESRVRFFSGEGADLGSFGGRGSGPGFFGYPFTLGWVADTLWIYDEGKISYVNPLTNLARIQNVVSANAPPAFEDGAMVRPELTSQTPLSVRPGGTLALLAKDGEDLVIGEVDRNGDLRRSLLSVPDDDVTILNSRYGSAAVPFASLPKWAGTMDGSRYALATETTRGPDAGTFSVTVVSADGDTIVSDRYRADAEPLPGHAADSVIAQATEHLSSMPGMADALRSQTVVPDVFPFVAAIFFGADRSIWVWHPTASRQSRYYVIAEDGSPIGQVRLPSGGRALWADAESVWVVERDDLDVESLVRYAIDWQETTE